MATVLRFLTTPYFMLVDFALDAPGATAALVALAGVASILALWR